MRKSNAIATPDSSQFSSKSLSIVGPSRNSIYLSNVIAANASTQQTVQHRFGLQHGSQGPAPNVTVNPNGNFNMNSNAIVKPGFAHSLRQFGMGSSSSALNSTNQQTPPAAITSSKLAAQLQTINQIASSQKQASAKVTANPSHLANYAHNIQSSQVQKPLQKPQQQFAPAAAPVGSEAAGFKQASHKTTTPTATSTEDQTDGTAMAVVSPATGRSAQTAPPNHDRPLRPQIAPDTNRNFDDDIEDINFDEFDDSDDDLLGKQLAANTQQTISGEHATGNEQPSSGEHATDNEQTPSINHQHHSNHFRQNQYHHHIATTNLQCLTPTSLNTSTTNINSSAALKILVRDVLEFVKPIMKKSISQKKSISIFPYFSYVV